MLTINLIFFWCSGTVFVKLTTDSEEEAFTLFRLNTLAADLPQDAPAAILPTGLDAARLAYLYNSIREFVDEP